MAQMSDSGFTFVTIGKENTIQELRGMSYDLGSSVTLREVWALTGCEQEECDRSVSKAVGLKLWHQHIRIPQRARKPPAGLHHQSFWFTRSGEDLRFCISHNFSETTLWEPMALQETKSRVTRFGWGKSMNYTTREQWDEWIQILSLFRIIMARNKQSLRHEPGENKQPNGKVCHL